jgi:cobyrinic acid a,c-diamide synthase
MIPGLIIAAPRSGSGKTVITLGLLRALRDRGLRVAAAKVGPDYIDPTYLSAAGGDACRNLDPWAMRPATLATEIAALARRADLLLCEGVMGLFDGAGRNAAGSTAELAALTGWPVILVIDAEGQGASVAALAEGFVRHRDDVTVAGVILNRVASPRHAEILRQALAKSLPNLPLLGVLPRDSALALPSRHLGLVPAGELQAIERFITAAAQRVIGAVEMEGLRALVRPARLNTVSAESTLPRLGARIAIARDDAFLFTYPSTLGSWRRDGAHISFFSPLADEAPPSDCDAMYLPGGYPELFAARLACSQRFLDGLREAAARGAIIYGECGGYMVLGEALIDAAGMAHPMAGLLPVTTSFAAKRLHLGYRAVALADDTALGCAGTTFRGHEFHYASIVTQGAAAPLFTAADADGVALGTAGLGRGKVMGSFIHLIDRI